jgi:quercetin dioxygenase-like cupin family protein
MEVLMKVTRFYATKDGESRFEEVEIPIDQKRPDTFGNTLLQSNGSVSPSFRFVELPQGMVQGWHHAPASQIVVILSGVMEVGTSDNQKRQGRPGQAFIADDLMGKGHTTRVVEGPARVLFVELPKSFDFGKWSA